jgi:hypothetical protein
MASETECLGRSGSLLLLGLLGRSLLLRRSSGLGLLGSSRLRCLGSRSLGDTSRLGLGQDGCLLDDRGSRSRLLARLLSVGLRLRSGSFLGRGLLGSLGLSSGLLGCSLLGGFLLRGRLLLGGGLLLVVLVHTYESRGREKQ